MEAGGVVEQAGDGGGEELVANDVSGIGTDDVTGSAVGGDDGGDGGGEGFEHDVAEGVGVGGEDEQIHVRVGLGEGFAAEDAGEDGVWELLPERGFQVSVTYDEEAGAGDAGGAEGGLDARKEGHIFLDGEAADEAEEDGVFVGVEWGSVEVEGGLRASSRAARGGEEVGVDAALHEMAGTVAHALEQGAELRVRSEEDAGEAIEAGGGEEGQAFDAALDGGGVVRGEMTGEPMHAAAGVLVDVGVPGGGERDPVAPGEPGAKDAELGGAGDVEEVGAEGAEGAIDGAGVADEERIEVEVFFERDGGAGAGELEGVEVVGGGGGRGAGADAEEGKAAAPGEGGEVAGGVGDAVDLVEGVGEEGDAGRAHGV